MVVVKESGSTPIGIAIGEKVIPIDAAGTRLPAAVRRFLMSRLVGPLAAEHVEPSAVASVVDAVGSPNQRLLDLALTASARARAIRLTELERRQGRERRWFEIWPGEHYKLLAALAEELQPRTVIEIGTFTGMGSLALLGALAEGASLTTFDVVPWRELERTWLWESDFIDRRLRQVIGDVSDPKVLEEHRELFEHADLVFVDGPKDGVTEDRFLENFARLRFRRSPIFVFDDIRLLNMLSTWRSIDRPKLDLTSFGHWSGTGLVDWCG